jgi:transposase-like protein
MSQHFLLSAAARSLSEAKVWRMSDEEAEAAFKAIRWSESNGKPYCPKCGCTIVYDCRRKPSSKEAAKGRTLGPERWRCKACRHSFSITSGTIFASHKLPFQTYLAAIVLFCNEVKGKSMLALSRALDVQYKTAFVLAHKMRESISSEVRVLEAGGPGTIVEIDGSAFGGYVKEANLKANRVDRRLSENKSGKEKWVVAIRERNGRTITGVFESEAASIRFIRNKVKDGSTVYTDAGGAWKVLSLRYVVHTIDHEQAYSLNGICTNNVESFFSRMARAEKGHHHHIAGDYFIRFAQEAAWREDYRRHSNGEQVMTVAGLALHLKPSVDFSGYWQRAADHRI